MLTDRRSVIRPTLTQTVITVFSHWLWTTSCGFVQYFTSITLIFNGEKEFEKHFSFRLNKFLNFSDICFSHHSALHTDPDKINTFHLVGETGPSGNRGLGRGKYFNIILCKHSFSSHSLKSPLVMSSAAGLRGQRGVSQITQLTHFSPPSSSAPSTGWALLLCL